MREIPIDTPVDCARNPPVVFVPGGTIMSRRSRITALVAGLTFAIGSVAAQATSLPPTAYEHSVF